MRGQLISIVILAVIYLGGRLNPLKKNFILKYMMFYTS